MYARYRRGNTALGAAIGAVLLALVSCGGPYRDGGEQADRWSEERSAADRLIVLFIDAGRFADALTLVDSVAAVEGEDPRLLGQKARALGGLGRGDEAVPLFERSLLADYASCENHLDFAVLLMKMGKIGRAITEFNEAKQFCGTDNMAMIHRNLAIAQFELGRRDRALGSVQSGLRYNPNDAYLLGLNAVLVMETEPEKAESLFVRAQGAGGLEPAFLYQYGLLLLNTDRAEEAVSVLDSAATRLPNDHEVRLGWAEALLRSGRPEEAEAVLRELRDRRPGADVTEALARALFRQERYEEALDLYRGLPESPEVMDRIAMCLHGLGVLEEAVEVQRRVIAARPGWAVARINMAVILAARGELEEARTHLERALEIDPDNATARRNLEHLREAMGDAGR